MNTGDIKSDLSERPPRRPTVKGFAKLQLKIKLPPVKSAKVVTTCTIIKLSYQFGIFQPFIK